MFKDRKDAGKKLAIALLKYKDSDSVILAIPKGGIEVACEVSRELAVPFFVLVVRKLPFPEDPEAGFGAIAEDGSTFLLDEAYALVSENTINHIKKEQIGEIRRRIKVLRGGKPLPTIKGKVVILVDDGLAMGSTMLAAITYCRNKKTAKVVVAVPISGVGAAQRIAKAADSLVVLEKPPYFQAVAQGYMEWHDVSDSEALELLKRCSTEN